MSGIYISGMEMPKRGHTVTLTIMGGGEAVVQYYDCKPQLTVPILYKAIPVPPHGRLIDADALIAWFEEWYDPNADLEICHVIDILDDNSVTPTIIPADREAEK